MPYERHDVYLECALSRCRHNEGGCCEAETDADELLADFEECSYYCGPPAGCLVVDICPDSPDEQVVEIFRQLSLSMPGPKLFLGFRCHHEREIDLWLSGHEVMPHPDKPHCATWKIHGQQELWT